MSYHLGHCPLCKSQIMVQDSNRKWNSFKPNFRQVDLTFADGHRVRTILCSDCFAKEPDFEKLMESITCHHSEACHSKRKERIKARGMPVSWSLAPTIQGASLSR